MMKIHYPLGFGVLVERVMDLHHLYPPDHLPHRLSELPLFWPIALSGEYIGPVRARTFAHLKRQFLPGKIKETKCLKPVYSQKKSFKLRSKNSFLFFPKRQLKCLGISWSNVT